jgi:hypothetical protein
MYNFLYYYSNNFRLLFNEEMKSMISTSTHDIRQLWGDKIPIENYRTGTHKQYTLTVYDVTFLLHA